MVMRPVSIDMDMTVLMNMSLLALVDMTMLQ